MSHSATRVLAVLELLQTHGRISGAKISARLQIERRTVRRYIALLEEIGIPITAERGAAGGYELVAGYKLPPMMFTADEAAALSLGLVAVRDLQLSEAAHAVAGAQAKLERVMPANAKARMRSLSEVVTFSHARGGNVAENAALAQLGAAAHERTGVRLSYQSRSGEASERAFDAYGLAFHLSRWYVVGYCHFRKGLRTFRVDRVVRIAPEIRRFERPESFDVMAHLQHALATVPRRYSIDVMLHTNLESARREVFPEMGLLEPAGKRVLLRSQADDLAWFARELSRLPFRCTVVSPAALRKKVADLGRALVRSTIV